MRICIGWWISCNVPDTAVFHTVVKIPAFQIEADNSRWYRLSVDYLLDFIILFHKSAVITDTGSHPASHRYPVSKSTPQLGSCKNYSDRRSSIIDQLGSYYRYSVIVIIAIVDHGDHRSRINTEKNLFFTNIKENDRKRFLLRHWCMFAICE